MDEKSLRSGGCGMRNEGDEVEMQLSERSERGHGERTRCEGDTEILPLCVF